MYARSDLIQGSPYGLDCAECPRKIDKVSQCDAWGVNTGYAYEGRMILNREWDHCPARSLRDPRLIVAAQLYRTSQICPLSGWPDSYAAWVERLIVEIDNAIQARRVEEVNHR